MKTGHSIENCPSTGVCRNCSNKHHTLLCKAFGKSTKHNDRQDQKSSTPVVVHAEQEPDEKIKTVNPEISCGPVATVHTTTLLMSLEVVVCNPEDLTRRSKALVFLDPGSQSTFIKTDLAERLGLSISKAESITLSGINGQKSDVQSTHVQFGLQPRENFIKVMKARTLNKIVNPQSTITITFQDERQINSKLLKLEQKLVEPDILIGIDHYYELKVQATKKLTNGFWLVESLLGNMEAAKERLCAKVGNKLPLVVLSFIYSATIQNPLLRSQSQTMLMTFPSIN